MNDDQHVQAYHDLNAELRQYVDNATGPLARKFSPHLAEHVISGAVQRAYVAGRHDALAELVPVETAELTLGVKRSYIHRLSRTHGIGWTIGRERLFRPQDIEALRAIMAVDRRKAG